MEDNKTASDLQFQGSYKNKYFQNIFISNNSS